MSAISYQVAFTLGTPQSEVVAAISRIYGGSAVPGLLAAADNPATGADAEETGVATSTVNTDGTVQLDTTGVPWDIRIHAEPASMTKAKVWRKRRNIDDTVFNTVSADLRAKHASNVVATPAAAPAAAPAGGMPPIPGTLPPPPNGLPPVGPSAYEKLCLLIGNNMQTAVNPAGRINADWVKAVMTHYQVADGDLQNLASAPVDAVINVYNGVAGQLGLPLYA